MTEQGRAPRGVVLALDELEHTEHSHELVGAEHGDVPFSVMPGIDRHISANSGPLYSSRISNFVPWPLGVSR